MALRREYPCGKRPGDEGGAICSKTERFCRWMEYMQLAGGLMFHQVFKKICA